MQPNSLATCSRTVCIRLSCSLGSLARLGPWRRAGSSRRILGGASGALRGPFCGCRALQGRPGSLAGLGCGLGLGFAGMGHVGWHILVGALCRAAGVVPVQSRGAIIDRNTAQAEAVAEGGSACRIAPAASTLQMDRTTAQADPLHASSGCRWPAASRSNLPCSPAGSIEDVAWQSVTAPGLQRPRKLSRCRESAAGKHFQSCAQSTAHTCYWLLAGQLRPGMFHGSVCCPGGRVGILQWH